LNQAANKQKPPLYSHLKPRHT